MKIFFNVVMIGILLKIAWEDFRSRRIRDRMLILLLLLVLSGEDVEPGLKLALRWLLL